MQFKKEYNNLPRTEKDRIIKQYKIENHFRFKTYEELLNFYLF